jgi:hypothetical protein
MHQCAYGYASGVRISWRARPFFRLIHVGPAKLVAEYPARLDPWNSAKSVTRCLSPKSAASPKRRSG